MASRSLELYEAIGAASGSMLEAARAGDWESLLAAEARCAALVGELRARAQAELPPAERERKREILLRVLAEDAEIRRHLQPWMAKLEATLLAARRSRRALSGYEG